MVNLSDKQASKEKQNKHGVKGGGGGVWIPYPLPRTRYLIFIMNHWVDSPIGPIA